MCNKGIIARFKMKKRNKLIWSITGVILLLTILFGNKIEDGLACLAYYDQCTAERIECLTKEQCFTEMMLWFFYILVMFALLNNKSKKTLSIKFEVRQY